MSGRCSVISSDLSDLPEPDYDLGEPSEVEESGDIAVTVTPESDLERNERLSDEQTEETEKMVCTVQRRRITAGGGPNILLNPELGTIWPGAILSAGSIARGQYSPALTADRRDGTPIPEIRQPLQLSLSLRNISGDNTRTIDPPSEGNYRTELDSILSQYDDNANTPANMSYEIRQIHSSEQLDIELGAHYNNATVDVKNQFDFSSDSETNKLLVKFYQKYYTADISLPNPLAEGIVSKPSQYLKNNDVVVDQVTYGRILLFTAESNYQRTRVQNSLDVAVNSGVQEGDVSLDIDDRQTLRETEITGTVIGGASEDAAQTISKPGEDALPAIKSFIQDGARYDPKTSPGSPIAYRTRYLSNLNTANTYLTTTYNERNCQPKTSKFRVHNLTWRVVEESDPGGDEDVYGDIWVAGLAVYEDGPVQEVQIGPRGSDDFHVWGRDRDQHKQLRQEQRWNTGAEAVLEFDNADNLDRSKSFIQVQAEPHEADDLSDEEWGNTRKARWYLNAAPSDPDRAGSDTGKFHSLHWRDHQEEIELSFDITPIPP